MLAFVLLLVGVLVLSLQDVLVKQTAADTSFWQLQTVRSTFNLTMIVLLAVARAGRIWPGRNGLCRPLPAQPRWQCA